MTDTLSRPVYAPAVVAGARRPRLQAGSLAGVRAALTGLIVATVPVLGVWAADSRVDAGLAEALRAAGQVWLVLHGVAIELPGGRLDLVPLGCAALPAVLLIRAAARAARQSGASTGRDAASVALAVAATYAACVTAVAVLAANIGVQVDTAARVDVARVEVAGALVAALVFAAVCAGCGAVHGAGTGPALWSAMPARVRTVLLASAGAVAVLLAGGALLAGTALAVNAGSAGELARDVAPGPVGGAALFLLGLALVPNAAVWGASWLAGPGFAVGSGTALSPSAYELGPVPALPLLAGLPAGPAPAWVGVLAYAVPLAAGAFAGWLVCRRSISADPLRTGRPSSAVRRAGLAVASGVLAGLAMAVLAGLSGGSAGEQRLAVVGPAAGSVGLSVALTVSVGAVATVLARRR